MAVYVLLSFDDDSTAKEFVKDLIAMNKPGGSLGTSLGPNDAEVLGAYKRPTKFCDCGLSGGKGKLGYSFTQGRKYGWWVHAECGKPTRAAGAVPGLFTTLGINLLPVSLTKERRYRGWTQTAAMWTLEELGVENATDTKVPSVSEGATTENQGGTQ